ncbi:IS3 family transposase [Rhodococcus sp. IEGM 1318]|uniref:IS3 family transposase n=1 Tax=Rhodococcus sp. IEGM 1318 TaxID=3082226 RepID=UPI002954C1B7|nr:IS3 family transposase [Rhodococcus sp. IEGM 1318]MDV8009250.1 IS3 family transposase [Rhodococcus sp. IEGM 1318]
MTEKRRQFSPQFKAEAVQMVVGLGRSLTAVARDLEINPGTLGNWVKAWREENPDPATATNPVEAARVAEMESEIRRLRMENEFLKKGRGLLRQDTPVAERCALIEAEKANYSIGWMCTLLDVPRSTFYVWRVRVETPTASRRRGLREQVRRVFDTSRQTYGCRRVAAQLNRDGIEVSVGTVAGIMRELRLCAVQPRAYKRTTIAGEVAAIPDLIDRDFTAQVPGVRLVGDITYLRTSEGWLYLATVIDLATRMVVGWQAASHMRTSLIVDALQMAVTGGHVRTGAVFHSDCGSQYRSTGFAEFAESRYLRTSVGRTGVCWDNAAAESFFATLKNEMYYRQRFGTRSRARFAVAEYIEVFYNRQRLHSTLGYRTPAEALAEYPNAAAAA